MIDPRTPEYRSRTEGWTLRSQKLFIYTLAETGSVIRAAKAAGRTPSSAYKLRASRRGVEFRRAWDAASTAAYARLSDLAMDRIENGVDIPMRYRGEVVATRTAYSDRLLIYMLERLNPDRVGAPDLVGTEKPPIKFDEFIAQVRAMVIREDAAKAEAEAREKAHAEARAALPRDTKRWVNTKPPEEGNPGINDWVLVDDAADESTSL